MCENFSESVGSVMEEIYKEYLREAQKEAAILSIKRPQPTRVNTRPFTLVVEGNIGSGKTTFLDHFQKFDNKVEILTEPVDKWRNANGHNLLEMIYEDPVRFEVII